MSQNAEIFQLNTRQTVGAAESVRVMSPFSRNVSQLLEHIEYRRCDSGEDLEDIYRLRYEAYLAAGMIRANASRRIIDEFDETPNSYCFGVYFDGHLVSTLRIHHVSLQYPESPSVKAFGEHVMPRLRAGETFIDPSRFAASAEWSTTLRVLPYLTLRLAMVASRYFDPTAVLIAIKEDHASFYSRVLFTEQVLQGRTYPGLTVPVLLHQSIYPTSTNQVVDRFPFFESTPLERRLLFERKPGIPSPLTVLPSTKYLTRAA